MNVWIGVGLVVGGIVIGALIVVAIIKIVDHFEL
jgi:hypothetical protein